MGQSATKRLWRQNSDTAPSVLAGAATIAPVPTAIASDFHLGTLGGDDVARGGEPLERLLSAMQGADRVVLLGDVLELREHPLAEALELARPLFERLGRVTAGRRLVLVPGNHDYQLAEPFLAQQRLDGGPLPAEKVWPVGPGDGAAGRLAELMPETEVRLAYPGLYLRPDVYATHGHYLDMHLTVPRLEAIAAGVMARLSGRGRDARSPDDYEAALSPMYSFYARLAEGAPPERLRRGSSLSRSVWRRLNQTDGGGRLGRVLLGRVTIPGAVAALNLAGFGPLSHAISGEELRRAGLRAMARVVEGLGVRADHVIFGHTHRAGPWPEDDLEEWRTPSGTRLYNSGSWLHETTFLDERQQQNPYWPGTVVRLGDTGDPEPDNVMRDLSLA
jgi:hypothetical protein